jgi:hypothetical protein
MSYMLGGLGRCSLSRSIRGAAAMMSPRRASVLIALYASCACMALPGVAEASHSVTLTKASNETEVTVRRGEKVRVTLTGSVDKGTEFLWSLPMLSTEGVLTLKHESRMGIHTTALYTATGDGSTTITSEEACKVTEPGHVCPLFVLEWRVGVTVTG